MMTVVGPSVFSTFSGKPHIGLILSDPSQQGNVIPLLTPTCNRIHSRASARAENILEADLSPNGVTVCI